jgi:hypothetical protein
MRVLVLSFVLLASAAVHAARPPRQLSEWDEKMQSERQAPVPTNRIDFYDSALPKNDKPFPWRAIGLLAMAMVVAAPFGIRTWRNLSNEMGAVTPGERRSRQKD